MSCSGKHDAIAPLNHRSFHELIKLMARWSIIFAHLVAGALEDLGDPCFLSLCALGDMGDAANTHVLLCVNLQTFPWLLPCLALSNLPQTRSRVKSDNPCNGGPSGSPAELGTATVELSRSAEPPPCVGKLPRSKSIPWAHLWWSLGITLGILSHCAAIAPGVALQLLHEWRP